MRTESPTPPFSRDQVEAIGQVAAIALAYAGHSLSRLLSIQVRIVPGVVTNIKFNEVPPLFGEPHSRAVGDLVPFKGDMESSAVFLFPGDGLRVMGSLLPDPAPAPGRDPGLSVFSDSGSG